VSRQASSSERPSQSSAGNQTLPMRWSEQTIRDEAENTLRLTPAELDE
jgi:hypothetical protein